MSYHWRKEGLAGSVGSIDLRRWEQHGQRSGLGSKDGRKKAFCDE